LLPVDLILKGLHPLFQAPHVLFPERFRDSFLFSVQEHVQAFLVAFHDLLTRQISLGCPHPDGAIFWVAALLLIASLVVAWLSYDFVVGLLSEEGLEVVNAVLMGTVVVCSGLIA
jgi:hypothetical protein